MEIFKENEVIRLDFEFYCFISSPFIYVSRVVDDRVCLDMGVVDRIVRNDTGFDYIPGCKAKETSIYKHGIPNMTKYPMEFIELDDVTIYYKLFDSIKILDGTSCREIINEIQK